MRNDTSSKIAKNHFVKINNYITYGISLRQKISYKTNLPNLT